jgi:hypothetical protein
LCGAALVSFAGKEAPDLETVERNHDLLKWMLIFSGRHAAAIVRPITPWR